MPCVLPHISSDDMENLLRKYGSQSRADPLINKS